MKKVVRFIKENFDLLGYIVLTAFFVCLQVTIWNNLEASIESDMSSELVLAKMLAQEKSIITKNWFYSTELKVLHNTLVFTPLFLISDNWHFIRMASIVILNIALFLSYYYLAKKLEIKHIPWIALLILGATSRDYYKFVILGTHYIPDIAVVFITLGLMISIFKNDKHRNLKFIILILLSFVSSLSGIRFVSALHIPLLVTSLIYYLYSERYNLEFGVFKFECNSFKFLVLCFCCFIASFVAVATNKFILPALGYSYRLDEVVISYIDFSFENVATVINGWLLNFGYQTDGLQAFSLSQLIIKPLFVVYFLLICYSVYDIFKNKNKYNEYERLINLFFVTAIVILSAVFIFTSAWYRNRYLLTVTVVSTYIIAIFLSHLDIKWLKVLLIILLSLFSIGNTAFQIKYHVENDSYIEFTEIRDILLENECYNGYCDWHWNGHNILTELSDGKIETWVFGFDIDSQNTWLQAKSHLVDKPKGKVFMLISTNIFDYDISPMANKYKFYEDDERIMFIFDNEDQIKEFVKNNGYHQD